jgi:hypothetical protein
MVPHFDREWQHLDQRSGRVVVGQLGPVTLPQPEEIRKRSCAIAGPINPSVVTKALKSSLNIRQQLLFSCGSFPVKQAGAFLVINQRARFSKTSFILV